MQSGLEAKGTTGHQGRNCYQEEVRCCCQEEGARRSDNLAMLSAADQDFALTLLATTIVTTLLRLSKPAQA